MSSSDRGPVPGPTSLDHLPPPPDELRLAGGQVHVWAISLAPPPGRVGEIGAVVSGDERARAERFRFAVHRDRFLVGRGALRRILALYTGCPPPALVFRYGERGKPELPAFPGLHFNLSHSEDLALLGLTRAGRLGVDVEWVRPDRDLDSIARRFFSDAEYSRLRELPGELLAEGFFNAWTRKEAYIKAVGEGLALPLDKFDVSLVPGEPVRFLAFRDPRESLERWSLHDLRPAPGFAGATALEGKISGLELWRWCG